MGKEVVLPQSTVVQFSPGRVDYSGSMARNYDAGRGLFPETAEAWRAAVLRHAPPIVTSVLDLGSGTGRFSALLAEWFGASVTAVEPAQEMRVKATEGDARPDVCVTEGRAEQIPLPDASVDL